MDVLTSALILYALTAGIAGVYILRDRIGFLGFFSKDKDSKPVGPSYWGVYNGSSTVDKEGEKVIKLYEIKNADDETVTGSRMYAKNTPNRTSMT